MDRRCGRRGSRMLCLSLIGMLTVLVLGGCGVAGPNIDPRDVEADVRADPRVAALDTDYRPSSYNHRASLTLTIDFRPRTDAVGVVETVSRTASLLDSDEFDEIWWELVFRSPQGGAGNVLTLRNNSVGRAHVPIAEAEARRWTAISAVHPLTSVVVDVVAGELSRREMVLRVPDHGSVIKAYDDIAAVPALPTRDYSNKVRVDVGAPDAKRNLYYETDGTTPSEQVVQTMQTLAAMASPEPPEIGIELEVRASSRPPTPTHFFRVDLDLLPAKYSDRPLDDQNAFPPGSRTDQIVREYEEVLAGSGAGYTLRVGTGAGYFMEREG